MVNQTNPIREGRLRYREHQIDPDNLLDPEERRRRAEEADAEFFRNIGRRSGEARRRRAELLAALEAQAIRRACADVGLDERVPS